MNPIRLFSRTVCLWPLLLVACGGDSRTSARETATKKTCDYYERCEGFAAGKRYPTRDNCIVKWAAMFESSWPPAECDDRIDQAAVDLCYVAIDTAECNSGGDFLHAVDKCQRANVCRGPSPP